MNVHKRCQKNVANNCGINPKEIALLLKELGIADQQNNALPANTSKPVKPVNGGKKAIEIEKIIFLFDLNFFFFFFFLIVTDLVVIRNEKRLPKW